VAEKGMAVLEAVATETPVGGGGRRRMRAFHDEETSLPRCESEIHAVFAALLLTNASRISAVWVSTFRDLSIGTLHSCA